MHETYTLLVVLLAGVLLGAFFFGGLWWTVRKGLESEHSALLFVGSLLLRISLTVTGFYFVSNRQSERLLVCLIGFLLARWIIVRLTQLPTSEQSQSPKEGSHAS